GPAIFEAPFSPEFCVRRADNPGSAATARDPGPLYQWDKMAFDPAQELIRVTQRLRETDARCREHWEHLETARGRYQRLPQEFDERTALALQMRDELEAHGHDVKARRGAVQR